MKYRGMTIERTAYQGPNRWYVQTHHPNGTPFSEDMCPQFRTQDEAKRWVRDFVKEAA